MMTELEKQDISTVANLDYDWDKLRSKTIFISGGTGFIGGFLVEVLKYRNEHYEDNIKIVVCSRRRSGINDGVEYIAHDIAAPLQYEKNVDYVIHLASNTHPQQYAEDPVGTITTNVFGTHNLLNLAKKCKARFLLASSVEIYGDGKGLPMCEDYCGYIDCNTVRGGYNESKRVSESFCQSYIAQYGVDCVIARFSRVFGADKKYDSKALAQFMKKAVDGEDIVLKSKGTQRFSYCYVADAVSGLLKILLDGLCGEAYNIADDDENETLGDYALEIANFNNRKVVYDICEEQAVSKSFYAVLDCQKLKAIGWMPIYHVHDALRRTFAILIDRDKRDE